MIMSPRKNMPDVGIELGAACMPSGLTSDRATAPSLRKGTLVSLWAFKHTVSQQSQSCVSFSIYILLTAITYSCIIAARHFFNSPHADVHRSISKVLVHLNTSPHTMWYEYQQASMYMKHSRSPQSAKKFSPSKSSFYHIVLTVQSCLDQTSTTQIAER